MATNAQAALQAAATHYSSIHNAGEDTVLACASRFKEWLDEQDTADRKARRAKNVAPKRQGGSTPVTTTEEPSIPPAGILPQIVQPYPSTPPPYPGAQNNEGDLL
jgi:hypothetical protein